MGRSALMRPRTAFASVSLGRALPWPWQTGPGRLPALSGPTCRSPPPSTRAMEPPPAPMVAISSIGRRTTIPKSSAASAASCISPPVTSDTSKDVPPRSPVITSGKPAAEAMRAAAMTPAAGPDSAVRIGAARAPATDIRPPLLCTMWKCPAKRSAASAASKRDR